MLEIRYETGAKEIKPAVLWSVQASGGQEI